jgi:Skp family chaperone for outer membrane proteins
MNRARIIIDRPVLVCVVILCAMVAYQARGQRRANQPAAVIATVNLTRVLEALDQRGAAEVNLKAKVEQMRVEQEQHELAIKALLDELESLTDEEQKQAKEEETALKSLEYEAWKRFAQDDLDVEHALLLQDLYRSIKVAIQEMAETEGYDLVVVDDSQGDLGWSDDSQMSREAQVQQQVRGRRLLHSNPTLDISDDLSARMNNAYRAGS